MASMCGRLVMKVLPCWWWRLVSLTMGGLCGIEQDIAGALRKLCVSIARRSWLFKAARVKAWKTCTVLHVHAHPLEPDH